MHIRKKKLDYLRYRRLAFALKEIRDTKRSILDIALEYGFSSHEAFTRAFKEAYSVSPKDYRKNPVPVVLRTLLRPFDCYLLSTGENYDETHIHRICRIYKVRRSCRGWKTRRIRAT